MKNTYVILATVVSLIIAAPVTECRPVRGPEELDGIVDYIATAKGDHLIDLHKCSCVFNLWCICFPGRKKSGGKVIAPSHGQNDANQDTK